MDDGKPNRNGQEARAGLTEVLAFIALVILVVSAVMQAHEYEVSPRPPATTTVQR